MTFQQEHEEVLKQFTERQQELERDVQDLEAQLNEVILHIQLIIVAFIRPAGSKLSSS